MFGPSNCEFCHLYDNADVDSDDAPYAPLRTWQGSLMANAARDPVFWAGVAVADADAPGETELCIRCHSPRAFLEGNGGATAMDDLTPAQQEGVECMLCHRLVEDLEVEPGNAMYSLDDVVVGTNVPRRGPWDFTDGVPEPPHSWINDPYIGTSRMCGTCHDVTTERERVDDAGVGLGVTFNEQRTYSEWVNSAYAVPGEDFVSCQDCHMPQVVDMPGCAQFANFYSHATGGRRHDLVGANRFVVQLLQEEYGSSGTNAIADAFFETTLESMGAFLPTAASLAVDGPSDVDLSDGLAGLAVTVTNNSGHKLPSGYSEGRVMWLEVVAEYGGEVVASSGAWDGRGGIQQDAQLRTYQAIGEDFADGTTFHLLRNNHWVVDSRIPPLGLLPDLQTDPVGDRYTLQGDGTWPNFDQHTYAFDGLADIVDVTPADGTDDLLTVTVRLRYLINTPEYIDFLGDEGLAAGADVATLFDLAGGAPAMTITEQVLEIPIVGFGAVVGTTGAASSSGANTTGDSSTGALSSTGPATVDSTGGSVVTTTTSETGVDGTGGPGQNDDDPGGCNGCRTDPRQVPWGLLMLPILWRRRRP
ncbi:MAG: hypothetical protein JKY37_00190 [Nannocystaceae bacterium]|nr:hypothetical protein [Nannocystaceae bacterium]